MASNQIAVLNLRTSESRPWKAVEREDQKRPAGPNLVTIYAIEMQFRNRIILGQFQNLLSEKHSTNINQIQCLDYIGELN